MCGQRDYPKAHLEAALAEFDAALAPAGEEGAMVLLDRLFSVLPMPVGDAGMAVWREMLGEYPPAILKAAVDRCIRRHKWNSPPSIADIIQNIHAAGDCLDLWRRKRKLVDALERRETIEAPAAASGEAMPIPEDLDRRNTA